MRPEQLARPEGFRNLVDFLGVLQTPDEPVPAERVGGGHHHELAQPRRRPAADRAALEHRRRVRRARRAALHKRLYRNGLHQGAGRRGAVRARQALAARSRRGCSRGLPVAKREFIAQGPAAVLPRHDAVEPAHPARRAPAGLPLQHPGAAAASRASGCRFCSSRMVVVPEPGPRRVRARRHRGALHLPVGVARGTSSCGCSARARSTSRRCCGASTGSGRCRCWCWRCCITGVTNVLLQAIAVHDGGEHRDDRALHAGDRARWRSASARSSRSSTPRTPPRSRRASAAWCS